MGEGEVPPIPRFRQFEGEDDGILDPQAGTIPPPNSANSGENHPPHVPSVPREAGHAQEIPYAHSVETEYGALDPMSNVSVLNQSTHRIMPSARLFRTFT